MSLSNALKILDNNRDEILLAEIAALIHDLGKLSEEFVATYASLSKVLEFDHALILRRTSSGYHSTTLCPQDILKISQFVREKLCRVNDLDWHARNTARDGIHDKLGKEEWFIRLDRKARGLVRDEAYIADNFLPSALVSALNALKINLPPHLGKAFTGDLIEQHHRNFWGELKKPCELLKAPSCDGIDSGVDKGAVARNASKQSYSNTFISTAFGYESKQIHLANLGKIRHNYSLKLVSILEQIKNKRNSQNLGFSDWRGFLYGDESSGEEKGIRGITKKAFLEALGETRRSANDVTLWDHSFSVASLYKASLVKVLLEKKFPPNIRELKWRILRVSFDGLGFISKAHHIPDILGCQKFLRDTLDKIKEVLEVKFPLGNEIYRDENGSAFIVPDLKEDDEQGSKIKGLVRKMLKQSSEETDFGGEIVPHLSVSKPSRWAAALGEMLSESVTLLQPDANKVKEWWQGQQEEICTVCQLRPQGYGAPNDYYRDKAKERNVCYICLDRRVKRSEQWATKELDTTIWLDEVADINGHVALIVGKFDLDHWLDGQWLNSMFTQSLDDWRKDLPQLAKDSPMNIRSDCKSAAQEITDSQKPYSEALLKLSSAMRDMNNLKSKFWVHSLAPEAYKIEDSLQDFITNDVRPRDVHSLVPLTEDGEIAWGSLSPELLLLLLWRKHPSFARLRRIWETTQWFWQKSVQLIREMIEPVPYRLEISVPELDEGRKGRLGHYHAYDVKIGNVETGFVWDTSRSRFISADNLIYLAKLLSIEKPEEMTEKELAQKLRETIVKDGRLEFYEQRRVGQTKEKVITLDQNEYKVKKLPCNYTPFIPVLSEPQIYLALVPANKAMKVMDGIRTEYEVQFSKVCHRLPLHLSAIFFQRHTPLYAAIDAARRMLRRKYNLETWRIKQVSEAPAMETRAQGDGRFKRIVFERKEDEASIELFKCLVSYSLGDPNLVDYYYPYFYVAEPDSNKKIEERIHWFKAPLPGKSNKEWKYLVHVSELAEGDEVYLSRSTFDFEFLDVTTRRFEISYESRRRRYRPSRPYLLGDIENIKHVWELLSGKDKLTTTQIRRLIECVETKREEWQVQGLGNNAFQRFVEDTLKKAGTDIKWWKPLSHEDKSLLKNWAVSGRLADVCEIYMEINKEKSQREE